MQAVPGKDEGESMKAPWKERVARIVSRHHDIHVRLREESIANRRQDESLRLDHPMWYGRPSEIVAELERLSVRNGHLWDRHRHHEKRLKRHSITWMIDAHYREIEAAEKKAMKARCRAIEVEQRKAAKARRKEMEKATAMEKSGGSPDAPQ